MNESFKTGTRYKKSTDHASIPESLIFAQKPSDMKTHSVSRLAVIGLALVLLCLLSSCANKESVDACLHGHTYGFWGGLWHGIIAPVDLVLMLFRDDFTVYAQNNNGAWYAFGFLIGSGGWGLLGGNRMRRKKN